MRLDHLRLVVLKLTWMQIFEKKVTKTVSEAGLNGLLCFEFDPFALKIHKLLKVILYIHFCINILWNCHAHKSAKDDFSALCLSR